MTPPDDDEHAASAEDAASKLEHEIDAIREDLEEKVGELSQRRREVTDLTVQARRHPWALLAVGAVVIGGAVGFVVWRSRRRQARRAAAR